MPAQQMKNAHKTQRKNADETIIDATIEAGLSQKWREWFNLNGIYLVAVCAVSAFLLGILPYIQPYFSSENQQPWEQDIALLSAKLDTGQSRLDELQSQLEELSRTTERNSQLNTEDMQLVEDRLVAVEQELKAVSEQMQAYHSSTNASPPPSTTSDYTEQAEQLGSGENQAQAHSMDATDVRSAAQPPGADADADADDDINTGAQTASVWTDWIAASLAEMVGSVSSLFTNLVKITPQDEVRP